MGDGFWFIAVVAEPILMLANLMQISICVAFSKMKPGCGDLCVPRWMEIFNFCGNRFFLLTYNVILWHPDPRIAAVY